MEVRSLILMACVCACVVAHRTHEHPAGNPHARAAPTTMTPAGVVRGSWMQTRRGRSFQAYRGLRYAEPPVGPLRFQPPRLITQYEGVAEGGSEGPACPQPVVTPGYLVDEDCLRLNVYTPVNNSSRLLPVLVYIHPGGFYSVSGRSDVAGPHYMLERDIVLVTINYRLGSLGFLSTGDRHAPGNNGFKDQVSALRWVQRNIRAFGGDPGRVTLAGYSAGSFSINLHMLSPMAKGLFHGAICMSASPLSQVKIGTHQRHLAVKQAQLLHCPTNSSQQIVDCLRTKTWKEIGDSLNDMFYFGFDPVLLWNVVEEPDFGQERYMPWQPLQALQRGQLHAVPYIVSQTRDEFFWKAFNVLNNQTMLDTMNAEWERIAPISFMLPEAGSSVAAERLRSAYLGGQALRNDSQSADQLGKLYSDAVIGFAVHRMSRLMSRYSSEKVFHYEFAYVGNSSHYVDPSTGKPTGAAHHDDLIYLLTLPAGFPDIELGTLDSDLVDKMTAIFYNFARYGDPNPRGDTPELTGLRWPPAKPDNRTYLRIEAQFSLHQNLFEDRYSVWNELYPLQY